MPQIPDGRRVRATSHDPLALRPGEQHRAALRALQPIVASWVSAHYRPSPNRAMAARAIYSFFTWLAETSDMSPTEPQRVAAGHVKKL